MTVPQALARRLGLRFDVHRPAPVRPDFAARLRREMIAPRILPKTANLQFHFDHSVRADAGGAASGIAAGGPSHHDRPSLESRPDINRGPVINLNGNGGEVMRCFYGRGVLPWRRVGRALPETMTSAALAASLATLAGYSPRQPYVRRQLRAWLLSAVPFARRAGIDLLDLFYWEQRMGNWGALYPREQDIAIEECSPLSNRDLFLRVLGLPSHRRCGPHFAFFREWAAHMWPEAMHRARQSRGRTDRGRGQDHDQGQIRGSSRGQSGRPDAIDPALPKRFPPPIVRYVNGEAHHGQGGGGNGRRPARSALRGSQSGGPRARGLAAPVVIGGV